MKIAGHICQSTPLDHIQLCATPPRVTPYFELLAQYLASCIENSPCKPPAPKQILGNLVVFSEPQKASMGSKENLRLTITRNTCLTPFESFINNRDDSTDCVAITGKACFYFVESFYTIECHPRTPATNVKCQFPSKAPVCSSRFYTIILKCVRNVQYLKCI